MATEFEQELEWKIDNRFYDLKAKIKCLQGDLTNIYAKLDAIHCHAYATDAEKIITKFDWAIYAAKYIDERFGDDGLIAEIEHLKKLSAKLESEKNADEPEPYGGMKKSDFF